jgi:hypothetical protein
MSSCPSQRSEGSNGQSSQQPQQQASGVGTPTNRRQKSWDLLDQTAIAQARQQKQHTPQQVQHQVSLPSKMQSNEKKKINVKLFKLNLGKV